MKKINTIIAIAIITSSALLSCSKQASKPSDPIDDPDQQVTSVVSDSWFSATWQSNGTINEYSRDVAQLGTDIIKDGKTLVFGRGGFEMRIPSPLPTHFDANYITASAEVGKVRLTLQGSGTISTSLQFRYILIPANKMASNLNYDDYNAVCDYYGLQK